MCSGGFKNVVSGLILLFRVVSKPQRQQAAATAVKAVGWSFYFQLRLTEEERWTTVR